jgi:hypothetical protein
MNMFGVGLWTTSELEVDQMIEIINRDIEDLGIEIIEIENIWQAKDKKYIFPIYDIFDHEIVIDICFDLNLTYEELLIQAINDMEESFVKAFEMDLDDVRFDDYITHN